MYIKDISLKDFRNYRELKTSFSDKVNIFIGNNAQGKTNLLESIYMNAMAKSFKNIRDRELIRFGEDHCRIESTAYIDGEDHTTEIVINRQGKKIIKIDGVKADRTSQLLDRIFIIIFSPEDLKIVKDEPEKRRRFIDRELCQIQPLYYDSLSNYKKTLVQRNTYLKEENPDSSILDLWDVQLAKYGAKIIHIREKFIRKISGFSGKIHSSITNGKETLFLEYNPNVLYVEDEKEQEGYFYDEIKKAFKNDFRQRTTTRGPHKDDISFYANGINMRSFGSQGQQRTCALSLKLAELSLIREETGEDAILLLDDVMSELDVERQEYLIKTLKENQIFITTADIDRQLLSSFPEAEIIRVENGKIIS